MQGAVHSDNWVFYHDALSFMTEKATRDWMKITNIEGENCEKNGGY